MNLSEKYRPETFEDIAGQELPREVLTAVCRNPSKSPRSIVLHGEYGTGKTSSARILARALNCRREGRLDRIPCGMCDRCRAPLRRSPYYQEYDCAVTGSAAEVRNLRDSFFLQVPGGAWRVVVFDEAHMFSSEAQSALLKILEESGIDHQFTIFCTTEVDELLSTIRSRSVELYYSSLNTPDVADLLCSVAREEGVPLTRQEALHLSRASGGHARNALLSLQIFAMVDDRKEYLQKQTSQELAALKLLAALASCSKPQYRDAVEESLRIPLFAFREAFYGTLTRLVKVSVCEEVDSPYSKIYLRVAETLRGKVHRIFSQCLSTWFVNAMKAEATMQGALWSLWASFGEKSRYIGRSKMLSGESS